MGVQTISVDEGRDGGWERVRDGWSEEEGGGRGRIKGGREGGGVMFCVQMDGLSKEDVDIFCIDE